MTLMLMMTPSPNISESIMERANWRTLTPKTEVKRFRKHRPLKPAEIGFRR